MSPHNRKINLVTKRVTLLLLVLQEIRLSKQFTSEYVSERMDKSNDSYFKLMRGHIRLTMQDVFVIVQDIYNFPLSSVINFYEDIIWEFEKNSVYHLIFDDKLGIRQDGLRKLPFNELPSIFVELIKLSKVHHDASLNRI